MYKRITEKLIIETEEIKMVRIVTLMGGVRNIVVSYFNKNENPDIYIPCNNEKEAIEIMDKIMEAIDK